MSDIILDANGNEILAQCPFCDSDHVSDWDEDAESQECFECFEVWLDEDIW